MKTVPIPERMAHLPRDRRGYPIPWGVFVDGQGTPQFTINDFERHRQCQTRDLCPICGTKLFRGRWFVGGPGAAFLPNGAYIDPPMHSECCHYALQVCPFIAAPNYSKRIEDRKVPDNDSALIATDTQADVTRPSLFVAVMATAQTFIESAGYFKPLGTFSRVEYWRHGQQLSDKIGQELSALALQEFND